MKKLLGLVVVAMMLTFVSQAHAGVLMFDWGFNANGADSDLQGLIKPIDQIQFKGLTFVQNAGPAAPGVAFTEYGTFQANAFLNGPIQVPSALNNTYQLTGKFVASGVNTINSAGNQQFVFTSARLELYIDDLTDSPRTRENYGDTTLGDNLIYGSNDGVLIGAFDLMNGGGNFNFPNGDGNVDIYFQQTSASYAGLVNGLLPGVWFDPNGIDMTTYGPGYLNIAFTDTNNLLYRDITAAEILDWNDYFGINSVPNPESPTEKLWTISNGSYQPGVVPEPASLVLLGSGLMALAAFRRKK